MYVARAALKASQSFSNSLGHEDSTAINPTLVIRSSSIAHVKALSRGSYLIADHNILALKTLIKEILTL